MRVFLIEDDSATAQSIELMLKSESFNVYTTDLGEEGVDLGKLYDYDIILLDLNLPDMSGYEVLRTLRVSKIKTPILILSGLAGIEDKVREQSAKEFEPEGALVIMDTLSGKKLEVPVKRLLAGVPVDRAVRRDTLADPSALDAFLP